MVKTRFAPSPTGLMHFGNVRTALFNFLYAKSMGGVFLLRIEDTDTLRSEVHFKQAICDDLEWLGLFWGEGPTAAAAHSAAENSTPESSYYQSERQPIYDHYYHLLEQEGLIYPCFCTEEQLAINRKVQMTSGLPPRYPGTCSKLTEAEIAQKKSAGVKFTYRFRIPKGRTLIYEDLIKGTQRFETDHIGDFIIRRGDGTASFMFCNAVDDAKMGVTHALRGEDHLTNTPRQILLLEAMKLKAPQYGHFPTILGPDGRPLSKRNGSRSIQEMRSEGYFPIGILNYLTRLGHTISSPDFLDLPELIKVFNLSNISHAPAHYDEAQLNHWQKEAMMRIKPELLLEEISKALPESVEEIDKEKQPMFVDLIQHNILFPAQAKVWADALFSKQFDYSPEAIDCFSNLENKDFFKQLTTILRANPKMGYKEFIQKLQESTQLKGKQLFMPLRFAWTGLGHGPELQKIFEMMGTDWLIQRSDFANAKLDQLKTTVG